MWNWIRVKHNHELQNINRERVKSWDKYQKTISSYITLLKREKKEGSTKWIINTKCKTEEKMLRYGITNSMIKNFAIKKWLNDLVS